MNRVFDVKPAQMAKTLGEAVCNQTRVKIVVDAGVTQEVLIGTPIFQDGLRIVTDKGTTLLPMKRIVDVENY